MQLYSAGESSVIGIRRYAAMENVAFSAPTYIMMWKTHCFDIQVYNAEENVAFSAPSYMVRGKTERSRDPAIWCRGNWTIFGSQLDNAGKNAALLAQLYYAGESIAFSVASCKGPENVSFRHPARYRCEKRSVSAFSCVASGKAKEEHIECAECL